MCGFVDNVTSSKFPNKKYRSVPKGIISLLCCWENISPIRKISSVNQTLYIPRIVLITASVVDQRQEVELFTVTRITIVETKATYLAGIAALAKV